MHNNIFYNLLKSLSILYTHSIHTRITSAYKTRDPSSLHYRPQITFPPLKGPASNPLEPPPIHFLALTTGSDGADSQDGEYAVALNEAPSIYNPNLPLYALGEGERMDTTDQTMDLQHLSYSNNFIAGWNAN
ncbi:hypothetical protein NPIL_551501 [Nephila pilipes]|uniref:Uncharacterized protein n=1 Tax=Nephila pilipes TaxID=299642 RepID=A0A8X6QT34_NEPPI|nr:hypothetical protein NPIL_551501 [Nephila pilipes]